MKNHSTFECSTHAEIDLLVKIGEEKAKGSKFYVYRFNNTTNPTAREPKNGKPCLMCQHMLKKAGVSRIHYINDNGEVSVMKNSDLVSLIAEPRNITKYYLEKHNIDQENRFSVLRYVRTG